MTATEKKMWRDYAKACAAKAPKPSLAAWARKYNVTLKGPNRVAMVKAYQGEGAAPPSGPLSSQKNCSDICHIRSFERWEKLGNSKFAMRCTLDSCEYNKEFKAWVCWYNCTAGIRLQ
jgi:hypothetical protein